VLHTFRLESRPNVTDIFAVEPNRGTPEGPLSDGVSHTFDQCDHVVRTRSPKEFTIVVVTSCSGMSVIRSSATTRYHRLLWSAHNAQTVEWFSNYVSSWTFRHSLGLVLTGLSCASAYSVTSARASNNSADRWNNVWCRVRLHFYYRPVIVYHVRTPF
jgi:hypothetical protein